MCKFLLFSRSLDAAQRDGRRYPADAAERAREFGWVDVLGGVNQPHAATEIGEKEKRKPNRKKKINKEIRTAGAQQLLDTREKKGVSLFFFFFFRLRFLFISGRFRIIQE